MKNLILAAVSAAALLGVAACSDSGTDRTTTQSTTQPVEPSQPGAEPVQRAPSTDDSTAQRVDPRPSTGTGGDMQTNDSKADGPLSPSPAQ